MVATRIRATLSSRGDLAPLGVSWLLIIGLMTLLTSSWIDPTAYFRAFSECYVVGCLILGAAGLPVGSGRAVLAPGVVMLLSSWFFFLILI